MSVPKSEYKVHIYKNDYNAMCTEVYKHQDIETGGNLFGLWTTSGSAIIHVMLGPGQNCKRTSTSFHQDLKYMARVGRFVNDNYMLCHIGEWHSHHNLSLSKPSAGDESTIRRNFPQGMSKFLVIIANIRNGDTIKLSPYFFTDGGTRYEIAEYKVFDFNSPFSTDDQISSQIDLGAEGKKATPKPNPRLPDALVKLTASKSKPDSSSSDSLANERKPQSPVKNQNIHPQTADQSLVKPHSSETSAGQSTPVTPNSLGEPTPDGDEEPMDTDQSDLYPPRDYDEPSASHMSVTTDSQQDTSVRGQSDPEKDMIVDEEPQSERTIILDQIHDHLKYWFGIQTESMFKYETSKNTPGADEITFRHNSKYWMVRFPKDFPSNPAKLFYTYSDSYNKCSDHDIVKPLINEESILLSIKNICGDCKVCKRITTKSVVSPRTTAVKSFSISLNELITKLNTSLNVDALHATPVSKAEFEISFKHAEKCWIIVLPIQFPDIPAKVHYLCHESSSQRHDALLYPNSSFNHQELDTVELIIQAIQSVEY